MEEFEKIYNEEMERITPEDKAQLLLILDLWLSKGGKERSLLKLKQDNDRFNMERRIKQQIEKPQGKKGKKKKKKR